MIELDFEYFYLIEVLNTSNYSDDVDIQRVFAGNIDNCSHERKKNHPPEKEGNSSTCKRKRNGIIS